LQRKTALRISADCSLARKDAQKDESFPLKNNSLNILFNQTSSSTRSKKDIAPIKGTVFLLKKNAQVPVKLTQSGVQPLKLA
jgi:hypothetical protein